MPSRRGDDYIELARKLKDKANWRCSICGWQPADNNERRSIVVHHVDRNFRNNELSNLVVICEKCHYSLTWKGKWGPSS